MAKFFIPILLFLVGMWVYVVIKQNQKVEVNEADVILKDFENYSRLNDSIKGLPEYADFFQMNYDDFSLFIPNHMLLSSELSTTAALQYENSKREFYLVLYTNQKDEYTEAFKDVNNYAKATIEGIKNNVTNFKMVDSTWVLINNCNACRMECMGDFNNGTEILPLKYKVLVTEFENVLYDLTEWTTIDNLSQNDEDMNKILSSVIVIPDVDKAREKLME